MRIKTSKVLEKLNLPVKIVNFPTKNVKGVTDIAKILKVRPEQVVKTLILKGKSGKFYLCLTGGNSKLDYKALKRLLKEKDIMMATPDEIYDQTGYKLGAIPAFELKNKLKTILASTLQDEDKLYIGTGKFGYDFVLSPSDLQKATGAILKNIVKITTTSKEKKSVKDYKVKYAPIRLDSKFNPKLFLTVEEAIKQSKGKVQLRGWVYRIRMSNKFVFIVLRDQSEIIQCIVKKDTNKKLFEEASKLTMESSIKISGEIKKEDRAPTGYEVNVKNLEIAQIAEPFPITKDFSTEFLLDNRHLWLRSRKMTAIMKIRHTVVGAIHEFFRKNGYYEFDAPIFQPSMCEGGSTLFEVKYFKDVVYLSQSWQLYAEAGIFSLGKIYNMSPTFRAEKSKTSRHLSEFWMAEMEAAWMQLDEVTQVAKDEIRYILQQVLKHNKKELQILKRDVKLLEHYAKVKYPTIKYKEALEILNKKYKMNIPWGKDLRTIEEEKIAEHFNSPVVVTHYPTEIMGFYKPPSKENPEEALCFDMLAPEGYCEIVGGSERSLLVDDMMKRLKAEGENPRTYDWYFDLRKYGSVPHSGYGLGVERVVAWICGIDNIKDAIPFPRTMLRKTP